MKTRTLTWSLLALALAAGCQRDNASVPDSAAAAGAPAAPAPAPAGPVADPALLAQAQSLFKPIPDQAPALPGNPVTPEKIALGKMLFFDGRLSASGTRRGIRLAFSIIANNHTMPSSDVRKIVDRIALTLVED